MGAGGDGGWGRWAGRERVVAALARRVAAVAAGAGVRHGGEVRRLAGSVRLEDGADPTNALGGSETEGRTDGEGGEGD